jgi:hypothetical protein
MTRKVYCKRTYFEKNTNAFPVNGKKYGEDYVKWAWGKEYKFREPDDYERGGHTEMFPGIYYYIETEVNSGNGHKIWSPIKEKEFRRHFMDVDELRNEKIEQILK